MSADQGPFAAIVRAARHGRDFYRKAQTTLTEPLLRTAFRNLAGAKARLADSLLVMPEEAAWALPATLRFDAVARRYAALHEHAARALEPDTLAELAAVEDAMHEAFEDTARDAEGTALRSLLLSNLPRVRACRSQLHELTQRLALA